jgi:hypothetical protein
MSWDVAGPALCGDLVRLGRSTAGQRLASSRRPLRWPLSRPAIHVAGHGTCQNPSSFAAPSSRSHLATTGSGRPTVSGCEGERRPLRPEVVPQLPVGVGPRGVAPPRLSLLCRKSRPESRDRDTEGTTSSLGDVPPHAPRAVPSRLQSRQQDRPCSAFAQGRPSGRLTRGERRPLRSKTSPQLRSTSVPCGTSLPPRSNS